MIPVQRQGRGNFKKNGVFSPIAGKVSTLPRTPSFFFFWSKVKTIQQGRDLSKMIPVIILKAGPFQGVSSYGSPNLKNCVRVDFDFESGKLELLEFIDKKSFYSGIITNYMPISIGNK